MILLNYSQGQWKLTVYENFIYRYNCTYVGKNVYKLYLAWPESKDEFRQYIPN